MRLWSGKRSSVSPSTDPRQGADPAFCGLRYDPSAPRGHVESWFLKLNDPRSHRALWLKWTIWAGDRSPERAVAEAWAIAFHSEHGHVATKSTVPFADARFASRALGASIDGSVLTADGAQGRVESGGRAIAFELAMRATEKPLLMYPRWMYTASFPTQKLVSPVPNARFSGHVEVDGERWEVEAWPGMLGHNWGRHTEQYVWGHCNAWDGEDDVVFEGGGGRTRAGGMLLPFRTVLALRHHGTTYGMSHLVSIARNHSDVTRRRWRFTGRGPRVEVEGEMWAETEDFVGLYYANPDGQTIHCLNSKVAHADLVVRVAGRAPRRLTSSRAALEIGTRDADHGVRMVV